MPTFGCLSALSAAFTDSIRSDPPALSREMAKVDRTEIHAMGADNEKQCHRFFVPFSDADREMAE
jgi:hypothetical protein